MSKPRWLRIIAIITFSTLFIFASTELAVRGWLAAHPTVTVMGFRATRPLAYANSVYWSPAFIAEQRQIRALLPRADEKHDATKDFHGRWYNSSKGWRYTTFQPTTAHNDIYLFGSSTMYGSE